MAKRPAPTWQGQRFIGVGFRRWERAQLRPLLALQPERVVFVHDAAGAEALRPTAVDIFVFWGATPPPGVEALAQRSGSKLVRAEDGFVRSVGLGSDLTRPLSLVLDPEGIYFDPTRPSALETVLSTASFSAAELAEAARVRAFISKRQETRSFRSGRNGVNLYLDKG